MKNPLLILAFILVIFSCKKKSKEIEDPASAITTDTATIDTIKPGSYYPVYPGSWWKYRRNNTTVFTDSASHSYVFFKYATSTISSFSSSNVTYESAYVPFYNNTPIFSYQQLRYPPFHGGDMYPPTKYAFLTETSGNYNLNIAVAFCDAHNFAGNIPAGAFCPQEILGSVTKTINVSGDSIIITKGYFTNGFGTGNEKRGFTYREYTKNIGLTFYANVDTVQHDTIEKWQSINYHIGPH